MKKNRKDMLTAVIIVVFVHLIVIFAVYLSFKKNDENKNMAAPLRENINHSSNGDQNDHLDDNSEAMLTLTESAEDLEGATETEKDEEAENKADQKDELAAELDQPEYAGNDDSSNDLEVKKDVAVTENSENKLAIKTHEAQKSRTVFADNDKIYVKDNVVLLNRDLPQSAAPNAVPDDVERIKADAEKANDELSSAINKIKKRNQQQIDQREQEKVQP